jgi:putative transposase
MIEIFNGTFKRDYVYENCLDSAEYVQSIILNWMEEYNIYEPYSVLNTKTPSEYFRLKLAA